MTSDADPVFMSEFYHNLKILSAELYKGQNSSPSVLIGSSKSAGPHAQMSNSASGKGLISNPSPRSLVDFSTHTGVPTAARGPPTPLSVSVEDSPEEYFSMEMITDRLRTYAKKVSPLNRTQIALVTVF